MDTIRDTFQIVLHHCIYKNKKLSNINKYNFVRILLEKYPDVITFSTYFLGTPLYFLTTVDSPYVDSVPLDIISKLISPTTLMIRCRLITHMPAFNHSPLENALYRRNSFMSRILLQYAIPLQFHSIITLIRFLTHDHPSLKYLCAFCIKSSLVIKTDPAYESLGLPPELIEFTKTLSLDSIPLPNNLLGSPFDTR